MLHDLMSLRNDGAGSLYWNQRVLAGFPAAALWSLARALDVQHTDVAELVEVDPASVSWARRSEPLSANVSNHLLRIGMAYHRLYATLKEEDAVIAWLCTPQKAVGGLTPIRLLGTDPGAETVFAAIEAVPAPKVRVVRSEDDPVRERRVRSMDDADEDEASERESDGYDESDE